MIPHRRNRFFLEDKFPNTEKFNVNQSVPQANRMVYMGIMK